MKTGAVAGMAGGIRRKCSETVVRKDRKGAEKMGGCSNPGVSSPVLALGNLGAATSVWPSPGQGLCSRSANRPVSTSQSQRRVTDWGCDSDGRKRRNEDSMHVLQRFWRRSHHSHHTPLERGGIPGGTHRWVFVLSRCATPCFVPRYPLLSSGWLRSVRSVGRFCARIPHRTSLPLPNVPIFIMVDSSVQLWPC